MFHVVSMASCSTYPDARFTQNSSSTTGPADSICRRCNPTTGPGDGSPTGDGRSTGPVVTRTLADWRAGLLNASCPCLVKIAKSDGLSPRTGLVSLSRIPRALESRLLPFRCIFCGFVDALLWPLIESFLFLFKSNFTCRKPRGDDIGDSLLDCPGDSNPSNKGESGISESTIRIGFAAYSEGIFAGFGDSLMLAMFACGT